MIAVAAWVFVGLVVLAIVAWIVGAIWNRWIGGAHED